MRGGTLTFIFFITIDFGFSCQIKNAIKKRKKTKRNDRIRHENRQDKMGENKMAGLQYYFHPKNFNFLVAHIEPLRRIVSKKGDQIRK